MAAFSVWRRESVGLGQLPFGTYLLTSCHLLLRYHHLVTLSNKIVIVGLLKLQQKDTQFVYNEGIHRNIGLKGTGEYYRYIELLLEFCPVPFIFLFELDSQESLLLPGSVLEELAICLSGLQSPGL